MYLFLCLIHSISLWLTDSNGGNSLENIDLNEEFQQRGLPYIHILTEAQDNTLNSVNGSEAVIVESDGMTDCAEFA